MAKLGATIGMAAGLCIALFAAQLADAQMPLPAAKPPDGATLFKQQCATVPYHRTCLTRSDRDHRFTTSSAGLPERRMGFTTRTGSQRQTLSGMTPRLDAWLTNPQAMIPDAAMAYRQAKPKARAAIIAYLKELN